MRSTTESRRTRTISSLRVVAISAAVLVLAAGCHKAESIEKPGVPQVAVAQVVQKDVSVRSTWIGTTEGLVNAKIYPKISGYLLKQNYKDGRAVKQGELLFQIDDREYKAALDRALADLAQKQAQATKSAQDLGRFKPLYAQQVVSRQDFDHVQQTARADAAAVKSAQAAVQSARLNEDWTQITSPIAGVTAIAKAQVGDLVSTTTLLTTVSQLDPIKVVFPLSEKEYLHFASRIHHNQQPGVASDAPTLQMVLDDGSTYKYPGQIYAVNRQVDVQTGTIQVEGLFPNPDNILRPGLYAKIHADTGVQHGALLVPPEAVLETQGQYQVAVVGPDNKIAMRIVQLGKKAEDMRIIEAGLKPGERVVTQGLQKIHDGMEVKPIAAQPQPPHPKTASAARQLPVADHLPQL